MATIGLAELNGLDREGFVAALGGVVETSPWVAGLAFAARPFPDMKALHAAFRAALRAASMEQKLDVLMAQPDLVAAAWAAEVAGLQPQDRAILRELDQAYRAKFGFPPVLAVKGANADAVREAIEQRLANDVATELKNALAELELITRFRLDERVVA